MKISHIVGIDEVGRGPLAGPIAFCACAAASDFDQTHLSGIKDSKKLSPQKREEWFHKLSALKTEGLLNFAYFEVSATEIDSMGLPWAIERAIHECLDALDLPNETTRIFLDGSLKAPKRFVMQETIIKGDEKIPIISAASIIAKVTRDRYMEDVAREYPAYSFEKHKGYGTAEHLKVIRKNGPSPIHRLSFLKNIIKAA